MEGSAWLLINYGNPTDFVLSVQVCNKRPEADGGVHSVGAL
jgi:hypothetical protein